MKSYLSRLSHAIDFWNLFIGIAIGIGIGIFALNALIPDADQMIRMYRLDQKSVTEDKEANEAAKLQGYLKVEGN